MKQAISWFDLYWTKTIQAFPTGLAPLMKAATTVGQPAAMGTLLAVCAIIAQRDGNIAHVYLYSLSIIAIPLASVIKIWIRRPRPVTYTRTFLPSYSFPSGHAYASMLTMGIISLTEGSILIGLIGLAFSILVGVSRIYRGAHFPTDVAAGWVFAVIVAPAVVSIGLK